MFLTSDDFCCKTTNFKKPGDKKKGVGRPGNLSNQLYEGWSPLNSLVI
jgi:hypothetical protein